jgi:hypothetical protein
VNSHSLGNNCHSNICTHVTAHASDFPHFRIPWDISTWRPFIGFPITVYLLECKMYQDAITCSEKVTTYNTELFWLGVGPLK